MLIKRKTGLEIPSSEITPEHIYLSRRQFMKTGAVLAAGTLLAACGSNSGSTDESAGVTVAPPPTIAPDSNADELGDPLNSYEDITNYNNYYEFSLSKTEVATLAAGYQTSPWQVEVGGLVNKPGTYEVGDLLSRFTQEERIYRLRCVEAWSMVIPWRGFALKDLLAEVEPTSAAKYVRFETVLDPDNMPGQRSPWFDWPYVEGLRLDEAMHDLTLLATGIYGADLQMQNGAPIRLVVPWKYGFKSIKSIVRIDLVDQMPVSLWMNSAPQEYGFYANVNPNVNHPRWSQATERRIGELGRRETLMFNGYADQVADLYEGLDLRVNY